MNKTICWRTVIALLFLFPSILSWNACQNGTQSDQESDSLAMRKAYASSPVLSPEESLKHFKLDEGLSIQLVASEPVVSTPIALAFDASDRIWTIEMEGYMPDTAGTDETTNPSGKIVILEDRDHDGVMDSRKVFMDSLILPRAISFYDSGVLIAEPPKLWFVENNHDTAGAKYVVDSNYAVGGNVEHKSNSLLRGIDNWIYNAKSAKRYRRINGKWVIQHTHFRGQWGITQDNYGRLFYNNNSTNFLGDYFLPGLGAWNSDQRNVSGFDENIVPDNRTYPIRPTPGVNRGYRDGVLDDSLRLVHFTAACGPLIYRGGVLGKTYEGNAFVAEPAGNLVKRNILKDEGFKVIGKQAYKGKEFLSSDDERFRPVNLYTGPDGALYVVDMYHGIIQDITYITPYLKNEVIMRDLTLPLNRGRLYKIFPKGKKLTPSDLSHESANELVDLLDNPNSWVRMTAQRLLTDGKKTEVENLLRQKMQNDSFLVGKIHAFWTLEGLDKLQREDIQAFLNLDQYLLQQQAIAAAVSRMTKQTAGYWLDVAKTLAEKRDKLMAPYIGFLTSSAAQYIPQAADKFLLKLAVLYKNDPYVSDAVISGLNGREQKFMDQFQDLETDTSLVFYQHLNKVILNMKDREAGARKNKGKEKFAEGKQLFTTYCEVCHGNDGNGIRSLGAPLNGSSWVTGDKQTLLSIVLYGLTGPIKIGDKTYQQPEVAAEMPGMAQNEQLSDEDIAQISSYIRNAWTNQADAVKKEDVIQARKTNKGRQKPFTMEELKQNKP